MTQSDKKQDFKMAQISSNNSLLSVSDFKENVTLQLKLGQINISHVNLDFESFFNWIFLKLGLIVIVVQFI